MFLKPFSLLVFVIVAYTGTLAQLTCKHVKYTCPKDTSICATSDWQLVFEDDFSKNNLDMNFWELQAWSQGVLYGNTSSQEYNSLKNIEIKDGVLKILIKKESLVERAVSWLPDDTVLADNIKNKRLYNYTSSNLWTKQKFGYGKFEARIKIPKGKGFWPAFWLYASHPWSEIDIFEFWNESSFGRKTDTSMLSMVLHTTTHYDYDSNGISNRCSRHHKLNDLSKDFHVYSLIWEPEKIEWYIDGKLLRCEYHFRKSKKQGVECTMKCKELYLRNLIYPINPMALILNVNIQNRDNSPDESTPFPAAMEVDWVRYYKRR